MSLSRTDTYKLKAWIETYFQKKTGIVCTVKEYEYLVSKELRLQYSSPYLSNILIPIENIVVPEGTPYRYREIAKKVEKVMVEKLIMELTEGEEHW